MRNNLNRRASPVTIYDVLISNGTLIVAEYPGKKTSQQQTKDKIFTYIHTYIYMDIYIYI